MMLPGITLVVTPLISLMKDQVDNLKAIGIPAACLHSGMSLGEMRLAMQKAELGRIKLLYLSPEKLSAPRFAERFRQMPVSLIVVDEAHCISQWGYDFRPSYLKIALLRDLYPQAPVLALTASATPEVVADIAHRLRFRQPSATFRRSFSRPNISYIVRHCDNKAERLLRVVRAVPGCGIVYVRSRRRTRELAELLSEAGVSAEFYHAGLAPEEKTIRQQRWKEGAVRIMVATNAFGMGIDKPDVRVVVHYDLPSSVEEYYQEAGRAGRDGKPSFAVVLASAHDKASLARRLAEAFPPKDYIADIYDRASVFIDLSLGEGFNKVFDFNFDLFCHTLKLRPEPTRSALNILTRAGYIEFDEDTDARARVMIIMPKSEFYDLTLSDNEEEVLLHLLRNYPGLFADYVQISETVIASATNLSADEVYHALLGLARHRVVSYVPRRQTPYLFYPTRRIQKKYIELSAEVYDMMRSRMETRINAMRAFAFDNSRCRAASILSYFGEEQACECGCCDVCRSRKTTASKPKGMPDMEQRIAHVINRHPDGISVTDLAVTLGVAVEPLAETLRSMADDRMLRLSGTTIFPKINNNKA